MGSWWEGQKCQHKKRRDVVQVQVDGVVDGIIVDGVSFLPARIIEICRPLLNAWLKSKRVWNSDTNGNHDKMAMGMKMTRPMMYSYPLASSFIDSQNPMPFIIGLQACPIFRKRKIWINMLGSHPKITEIILTKG